MTHDTSSFTGPAAAALPTASGKLALKRLFATVSGAAIGLYGMGAVISYSPFDPSFNVASDQPATNFLGAPGAMFADLVIQALGAAAPLALAAAFAAGAIRIACKRATSRIEPGRLVAGAGGMLLVAGAASFLPTPGAWPLDAGFGGLLGDTVGGLLQGLISLPGIPYAGPIAGALAAVGGIGATGYAFRVKKDQVTAAAASAGRAAAAAGISATGAAMALAQKVRTPRPAEEIDDGPGFEPAAVEHPRIAFARPQRPATEQRIETPNPTAARLSAPTEDAAPEPRRAPMAPQAPQPRAAAMQKPAARPAQQPAQSEFSFADDRRFRLPPLDVLTPPKARAVHADGAALKAASQRLAAVLADFGVQGEIVAARPGPVVTLFELEPAPGVKSSRVIGLADDIARSMSATAARVAVIPGRNAIGIELPNPKRETVFLRSLLDSNSFVGSQGSLTLALGETIEGESFATDLAKMPHLLIAGTTGSGKSVGINAMILSLLYRMTPDQCRFIMIDPKMLELSVYEGIPHLLSPVVTDPKKAVVALKWTVREMEERYRRMAKLGVRNIQGYNDRIADAVASGEALERQITKGFDAETGEPVFETETLPRESMPYIVVIIDEMADLMLTAGKEIEAAVQRLAQMARAAGIHVIMATQRPSVDVITGTIKANFPTRISYSVTSKIDSRTILGEQGAEQLLGMGDLLFMAGGGRIRRLHGPFVSDTEVERVVALWKAQGTPAYRHDVLEDPDAPKADDEDDGFELSGEPSSDDLYDRAVHIVVRDKKASVSYLQRRLQLGYNRAATLVERMEKEGVISSPNAAGKREILVTGVVDD